MSIETTPLTWCEAVATRADLPSSTRQSLSYAIDHSIGAPIPPVEEGTCVYVMDEGCVVMYLNGCWQQMIAAGAVTGRGK